MTANVATSTRYQDPRSAVVVVVVVVIVVAVRCHDDGGDCPKVPFRGEMGEEGIRTPKKRKGALNEEDDRNSATQPIIDFVESPQTRSR